MALYRVKTAALFTIFPHFGKPSYFFVNLIFHAAGMASALTAWPVFHAARIAVIKGGHDGFTLRCFWMALTNRYVVSMSNQIHRRSGALRRLAVCRCCLRVSALFASSPFPAGWIGKYPFHFLSRPILMMADWWRELMIMLSSRGS